MTISNSRAADLLCSAFEGGSNYWYNIVGQSEPTEKAKPWGDEYTPSYISIPFSSDGMLVIQDIDDGEAETYELNLAAINKGIELFTTNPDYSHYYADVLKECDDADTGDVFLQLCLFGEVIYG